MNAYHNNPFAFGPTAAPMVSRDIPIGRSAAYWGHGLYARNNTMIPQTFLYAGMRSNVFCDGISPFLAWHRQEKALNGNVANGDFHLHV